MRFLVPVPLILSIAPGIGSGVDVSAQGHQNISRGLGPLIAGVQSTLNIKAVESQGDRIALAARLRDLARELGDLQT